MKMFGPKTIDQYLTADMGLEPRFGGISTLCVDIISIIILS